MLFQAMHMYGVKVNLTKKDLYGAAPDGTMRPGADIQAIIGWDNSAVLSAGETGADIEWWVNGVFKEQVVASGYNGSLGGYYISHREIAPQSGTLKIEARSANTITFNITVSGTDTSAGQVMITGLSCWSQQNNPTGAAKVGCNCDPYGVVLYPQVHVVNVGNGMAYYDVLVNGSVVSANNVASTSSGDGTTSVTISCPSVGSRITVKGKSDSGASIVLEAKVPDTKTCAEKGCPYGCESDGITCKSSVTCPPSCSYGCIYGTTQCLPAPTGCQDYNCPTGQKCVNGACAVPGTPTGCSYTQYCPDGYQCNNNVCTQTGGGGAATPCTGLYRGNDLDPQCIMEKGNEMYLYGAVGLVAFFALAMIVRKKK